MSSQAMDPMGVCNWTKLALLLVLVTGVMSTVVIGPDCSRPFNFETRLEHRYDFVVVGGGPAGSVVASRLSEDPRVTVLLLEGGPDGKGVPFANLPAAHPLMYFTEFNSQSQAQFDPTVCRAMENNTCPSSSGRGLGGTTNMNPMLYTRGNKQDYDNWAQLGNKGWSYDELLQYFIKMETVGNKELQDNKFRGTAGNIFVGFPAYKSEGSKVFLEAGKELNYSIIDYNKPYGEGFGDAQVTIQNGKRFNAVTAYLEPAQTRNNLQIVANAVINKIVIDPRTKTAEGVELIINSNKVTVEARKEVILSSGAVGSAKLLMLSGVGPAEHLKSLGIPLIKAASVGDNLMEHVGTTSLVFIAGSPTFSYVPFKYTDPRILTIIPEYYLHRDGPLASPGVDSFAYLKTKYSQNGNPDVQLQFSGFSYNLDFGLVISRTLGIRPDVYNAYWRDLEGQNTFTIGVMGCYPKSRGKVRLASANPDDSPIVINNFFNDTTDLKVIIEGMKMAVKIAETKAMKNQGVTVLRKQLPGCLSLTYGTDQYWECAVRQITQLYNHQSGTCKMGPDSDPTAVVDSRLRVKGISGLRVVDSSIMPTITAGDKQAPCYVIGEKAAAMIKEDNRLK